MTASLRWAVRSTLLELLARGIEENSKVYLNLSVYKTPLYKIRYLYNMSPMERAPSSSTWRIVPGSDTSNGVFSGFYLFIYFCLNYENERSVDQDVLGANI